MTEDTTPETIVTTMTDDTTPSNENPIVRYLCYLYFVPPFILIVTGLAYGLDVVFKIGLVLFFLPLLVSVLFITLGLAVSILAFIVRKPFVGALLAFVGVNITMIATHGCPQSLGFLAFGCISAVEIPILIFYIWCFCRPSQYQRKAVVVEAIVVNQYTEENSNSSNNDDSDSTSSLKYYWVGEYEAPSLQYVKPNGDDEKQTTIQPFHNGYQQGAEKNGLEEYCKEEEEDVCYKMRQRFQKKFLVPVELYQAASLELLVLPGRPKKAMLAKTVEKRCEMCCPLFLFFIQAGLFSITGFVIPLKVLIASMIDKYGQDRDRFDYANYKGSCSQLEWQTYVPYITLVLMVILTSSYAIWNNYEGEFEAVAVHPAGEQELTVVGPQEKKEDKYHHGNDDDETACTREVDNDDETVCTQELGNDEKNAGRERNGAFLV